MVTGIEPRSRGIRREATTDARQKRSATRSPTKDRGGQEKQIPRSPDCGPESHDHIPPGPTGHHPRPGPGPEGLLATSLYEDPSAGLHEDASARLREHPALLGCSILRRPSPPSSVGGHQHPAGGHEEGTVAITESDRIFGTLH